MKSNKSIFFREIAFLAVLKHFPRSKIDFWPFLKLQNMEFGQKKFREKRARKFKKVQAKKKSWIQIKQFHEIFFDKFPCFAISKMAKNQFLNW